MSRPHDDVHESAAAILAASGRRYTDGRRVLVAILAEADRPLTTAEIVDRAPRGARLPQSTVYRNLVVLEAARVVRRVAAIDEFGRYELDEQMTGHHHHLLCSACGHVEDVTLPAAVESTLDAALDAAARAVGFEGTQHRLDLVGRCAACR